MNAGIQAIPSTCKQGVLKHPGGGGLVMAGKKGLVTGAGTSGHFLFRCSNQPWLDLVDKKNDRKGGFLKPEVTQPPASRQQLPSMLQNPPWEGGLLQ